MPTEYVAKVMSKSDFGWHLELENSEALDELEDQDDVSIIITDREQYGSSKDFIPERKLPLSCFGEVSIVDGQKYIRVSQDTLQKKEISFQLGMKVTMYFSEVGIAKIKDDCQEARDPVPE